MCIKNWEKATIPSFLNEKWECKKHTKKREWKKQPCYISKENIFLENSFEKTFENKFQTINEMVNDKTEPKTY